MKKGILLNAPLSKTIAMMGHGDMLCIADAGLPIPWGYNAPERIDLAVSRGIPSFLDVLEGVLNELMVEHAFLANEINTENSNLNRAILKKLNGIPVTWISHGELKHYTHKTRANVRSGECTPYANIILQSGVAFTC